MIFSEAGPARLRRCPLGEKGTIARMLPAYLLELVPRHRGAYPFLDLYWTHRGRYPWLIEVRGQTAGFALVSSEAQADEHVDLVMAEFYVRRRYRGRGLGTWAASTLLRRGSGVWEVAVLPDAPEAMAFWRRTIGLVAANDAEPCYDEGSERWLFRFAGQPA